MHLRVAQNFLAILRLYCLRCCHDWLIEVQAVKCCEDSMQTSLNNSQRKLAKMAECFGCCETF